MNRDIFLNNGNLEKYKGATPPKYDFEFPSTTDFFSLPSNLIPGIGGVAGGRVLLGAKAVLQAIPLVHRELPLVHAAGKEEDDSFNNRTGKVLLSTRAKAAGKVTDMSDDHISVKTSDGKTVNHDLYNNFNYGRKTGMHSIPRCKVGDEVKKGDVLAGSNYTDTHGNMALGVNLRVAVMPYRSNNFEDAYVVTESGAKKLEAEQLMRCRIEAKLGVEVDKNKFISLFPNQYLNSQLANIELNGMVKKGTMLHHGDPIFLALSPKTLKATDMQLGNLSRVLKNFYRDNSQTWDYESPGEVVDVSHAGDLLTVNVKTKRGLAIGDKLSVAFGAKGVTGTIISDAQAPQDEHGKPVDIMLNSMSITSRVAPALAVVLGMGKVAQKLGKSINVPHFRSSSAIQDTIDTLKKHGISDTEKLYDPVTGTHVNVLTGPLYFTRLVHIAEDKISGRSQGIGYSMDMQPTKTDEESAKRVGNLATTALLSHGATSVLQELGTIKSTKNDEYWRTVKLGLPAPSPNVPFIFHKFIASLQGAGVNVTRKGNLFNVLPMTDKDTLRMSNGAIANPGGYKVKGGNLVHEPGGMFDPTLTGILGDKFNHINLTMHVPNPISEDYLRKLLGVTKEKYYEMIVKNEVSGKLATIDIDAKLKEYLGYLRSGKKTDRDDALKLVSFLKTLKGNGMKLTDLMLTKVPVLPAQYRPVSAAGDRLIISEVNHLYKELMVNNNALKNLDNVPPEIQDKLKLFQYNGVKAVFGLGEPITAKSREKGVRGLLSATLGIKGGSAKSTMFQAKVVNKPIELVGRAVLSPDAKLDLDDAYVPQAILWKTYAPFIIRRMVQRGVPATKAAEYLKNKNPLAQQALLDEMKVRPAIISREPALHKFNLMAFYLKPNPNPKDQTLKLNPLVFKGFNADNDGDQLNISVPASDAAVEEMIDKMLPSRSLLSPKNFKSMYVPSNEAALGLFQASTEDSNSPVKKYKTHADVIKDFNSGKLHVADRVEVG